MEKEPIIIKIKDLRQAKDLTQEALAESLGISRQSVIAIENGRYMPSVPLACEIAKFFEVSLDELFSLASQNFLQLTNLEDKMRHGALSPWSPFRELRSMQDEMGRLFEEGWPAVERAVSLPAMPQLNMRQDEKNIYVEMPVPGYTEEDIDLEVAEDYLTISGQIKKEDEEKKRGYFRQEYACQSFSRTIPFPVPVKSDNAEAFTSAGVLTVTIPKAEPEKPKAKKLAIKKK